LLFVLFVVCVSGSPFVQRKDKPKPEPIGRRDTSYHKDLPSLPCSFVIVGEQKVTYSIPVRDVPTSSATCHIVYARNGPTIETMVTYCDNNEYEAVSYRGDLSTDDGRIIYAMASHKFDKFECYNDTDSEEDARRYDDFLFEAFRVVNYDYEEIDTVDGIPYVVYATDDKNVYVNKSGYVSKIWKVYDKGSYIVEDETTYQYYFDGLSPNSFVFDKTKISDCNDVFYQPPNVNFCTDADIDFPPCAFSVDAKVTEGQESTSLSFSAQLSEGLVSFYTKSPDEKKQIIRDDVGDDGLVFI